MSSRKISDLVPELQALAEIFSGKMAEAGIPFTITCTMRSQTEQDELYAKGRTEPGPKVTWTLNSKHIPRTGDKNRARAFDIAILRDGKPVWDTKVNVNKNDEPDYLEAGKIGESIGLRWGGRFSSPDMPHFEL